MAFVWLMEAEHKFKEARKTRFKIFQLLFGKWRLLALGLGHQGRGSLFLCSCDVHVCMADFVWLILYV